MTIEVIKDEGSFPIKSWTVGVKFEEEAKQQLRNLAKMPFIHRHIAVMSDVHKGIGSTVGSVIATKGAIIPATAGVDLGCGVSCVRTSLTASDLPESLAAIRSAIEQAVPHGRTDNGGANDRGAWGSPPDPVNREWSTNLLNGYKRLTGKHPKAGHHRPTNQMCSLGTGNHFIEVCLDEAQAVWVMLHSGSRGPGNSIGQYFIERAKKEMQRWFINLPDEDLAYLPEGSELFDDYLEAVEWAQEYALANRDLMMKATLAAMAKTGSLPAFTSGDVAVNCHHNYIAKENHFGENVYVTRKGAVRARESDLAVIPGSMGTRSYICRGKGNAESFSSCSHGAGRAMSRTEARKKFSVEDHEKATDGVECRKDASVLDETPGAYKPIEAVISAQKDLIEVVHELRAVLCVKG